eukprot:scaffold17740_cov69-Phaeocystis_antarctica.AAC.1
MSGHPPELHRDCAASVAQDLRRSEALAEQPAVARSAVELAAASMLHQGVARCGARPSTY